LASIQRTEYRGKVAGPTQINSILRESAMCHFSIGLKPQKSLRDTKKNLQFDTQSAEPTTWLLYLFLHIGQYM
jgi:hypothetical protein